MTVPLSFTTHLHDATMVKAYIDAHYDNPEIIRKAIDKHRHVRAQGQAQ